MKKGLFTAGICAMVIGLVLVRLGTNLLIRSEQINLSRVAPSQENAGTAKTPPARRPDESKSLEPEREQYRAPTKLAEASVPNSIPTQVDLSPKTPYNVERGGQYLRHIVAKFNPKYFTFRPALPAESGRVTGGSSAGLPELELEYNWRDVHQAFGVECLYRTRLPTKGLEWTGAPRLAALRDFARERNIPVFVIIGEGGEPSAPSEIFIVPLQEIAGPFLPRTFLTEHRRRKKEGAFYFNTKILRLE